MALVTVALFIPNLIVLINNKKQISLIHQGGKQSDSIHRKASLEWQLVGYHLWGRFWSGTVYGADAVTLKGDRPNLGGVPFTVPWSGTL